MTNEYRSDNPDDDFIRWDEDKQCWLQSQPMCDECGEHIQEDYYYKINGRIYCPECIEDCKEWID